VARSGPTLCLCLLTLTGCAGPRKKDAAQASEVREAVDGRYAVKAGYTPLFKYGPAQAQGPDLSLKQGDVVLLLQRTSGFSRVRTNRGVEGYVANDRLEAAPPEPVKPPPPFRINNPASPEWLKVVPLDQMIEEPPLPAGTAGESTTLLTQPTDSHGQNDHQ